MLAVCGVGVRGGRVMPAPALTRTAPGQGAPGRRPSRARPKGTDPARPTAAPAPSPGAVSRVVAGLELAWALLRRVHGDMPERVAIVVSAAPPRASKVGHFAAGRWAFAAADGRTHEVWLSAHHLGNGPEAVLEVLLHEGAHAANHAAGIDDCSVRQIHNAHFRRKAESYGLTVGKRTASRGYGYTELGPGTAERHADAVAVLRQALEGYRLPEETHSRTAQRLLLARCPCGGRIRLARAVLERHAPVCGACGERFTVGG